MFVSRSIHANHADLIHDVSYDFYGRRMATCSSDQMVKIWDLNENGEWVCTASWRYHLGSAWRVDWAHPEFGQVIATCSFDRTIAIWEEIPRGQLNSVDSERLPTKTSGSQSATSNWVRRAKLVDPRTSVTGLQFAPKHLGLQLAAISTDGMLRIYEALVCQWDRDKPVVKIMDVMNLSQWRLQFDFGTKMAGSCLAWSQSRSDPPLIVVGSASPSDAASLDATTTTATTTTTGDNVNINVSASSVGASAHSMSNDLTASQLHGQNNVALVSGKLVIYEYSDVRRHWDLVEDVRILDDSVYDVSFAPHMGQSFHTLAVGSNEMYIFRIRSNSNVLGSMKSENPGSNATTTCSAYEITMKAHFNHHKGRVWRVSWNVTGSLLASSGDDGCVRLWQANYLGIWLPVSVITPEGSSQCRSVSMPSNELTKPLTSGTALFQMCPMNTTNEVGAGVAYSKSNESQQHLSVVKDQSVNEHLSNVAKSNFDRSNAGDNVSFPRRSTISSNWQ